MTLFDLLFLFLVLVSAITLLTVAGYAVFGKRGAALGILRQWALGVIIYTVIVAAVGLAAPEKVIATGEPWCFDDWCLTVTSVTRDPASPQVAYRVALRITSRARRVWQSARGAWVYVIDQHGHRYAPDPDPSATPLDVRLGPGESVETSRIFRVPDGIGELGLVTGHGGCCIGRLIIGDDDSLFHKPTYIRLTP